MEQYAPDGYTLYKIYKEHNDKLWLRYEAGEITQQTLRKIRFAETFREIGLPCSKEFAISFSESYLDLMPSKTALMSHAREVLEYLYNKECRMALVSNGFRQVQYQKVRNSGLEKYFDSRIFISEVVGYHKPNPKIFIAALTALNGKKKETLMVGDNFINDIEGAQVFGIDQYYFNPGHLPCNGAPTFTGDDLRDLIALV